MYSTWHLNERQMLNTVDDGKKRDEGNKKDSGISIELTKVSNVKITMSIYTRTTISMIEIKYND